MVYHQVSYQVLMLLSIGSFSCSKFADGLKYDNVLSILLFGFDYWFLSFLNFVILISKLFLTLVENDFKILRL